MLRIVLDTNVFVAALRSSVGASARVVELFTAGRFQLVISLACWLEYEEQLRGLGDKDPRDVDDLLAFIAANALEIDPRFRLRPTLQDADDEFLLELAFAAGVDYLVTFNQRDFRPGSSFGVRVIDPRMLLQLLEKP